MTLSVEVPYIKLSFSGDGAYPFTNFTIYDEDDLTITYIDAEANEYILTIGAGNDYTVALAGDAPNTATVTVLATCTHASETDGYLEIERIMDIEQNIDLENNGPFNQETFEQALDQIVMVLQQQSLTISQGANAITWRGDWATSTAYVVLDIVKNAGKWYVCQTAHTSGTFSTDLGSGYWSLFLEEPSSHTIASHSDTTATGTELETLTDDSMADALHRHSELSASDGTPNPAFSCDVDGICGFPTGTGINEFSTDGTFAGDSDNAVPTEKAVKAYVTAQAGDATPVGSVFPWMSDSVPTGFLECDGSTISRTTYSGLFAVIGDVYGVGDGSTTFKLPDLRGQFLRGFDNGAGTDPSAGSRTDSGDGSTTGDNVGTKQADATARPNSTFTGTTNSDAHTHQASTTQDNNCDGTGNSRERLADYSDDVNKLTSSDSHSHTVSITGGGDNETRPLNVSVMYVIKF